MDLMEASKRPTSCLVLPVIGMLIDRVENQKDVIYNLGGDDMKKLAWKDVHKHVSASLEKFLTELVDRFERQRVGHVEDMMLCTILDPR